MTLRRFALAAFATLAAAVCALPAEAGGYEGRGWYGGRPHHYAPPHYGRGYGYGHPHWAPPVAYARPRWHGPAYYAPPPVYYTPPGAYFGLHIR